MTEDNAILKRYHENSPKIESKAPEKPKVERKPVGRPKGQGKTNREERNRIWNTADELRYIRNIGRFAKENLSVRSSLRVRLLKLYLDAAQNRNWPDQVNGKQCIEEAQKELMKSQERR